MNGKLALIVVANKGLAAQLIIGQDRRTQSIRQGLGRRRAVASCHHYEQNLQMTCQMLWHKLALQE